MIRIVWFTSASLEHTKFSQRGWFSYTWVKYLVNIFCCFSINVLTCTPIFVEVMIFSTQKRHFLKCACLLACHTSEVVVLYLARQLNRYTAGGHFHTAGQFCTEHRTVLHGTPAGAAACGRATAGTTRAVPDCSTNHSSTDPIVVNSYIYAWFWVSHAWQRLYHVIMMPVSLIRHNL